MANKKGITYYKLESTYDGDKTKYCGLTGAEIDSNFHYLRGQEIKTIEYDKDNGILTLTILNGKQFVIEGIKSETKEIIESSGITMDGTYFDNENAALHLVINGEEYVVENVRTNAESTGVFTNGTIVGDGTITDALGVSEVLISSYHGPGKAFVDVSSGETLPKNVSVGDIYVTKESIGSYGLLYNYEAIKAIESILKKSKSQWHVPTLDEWSAMLDAIEDETCSTATTHFSTLSNVDLGQYAGLYLKAKDGSWKIDEEGYDIIDDYGFSAYPCGYADEWGETHNFGKKAIFWTSSVHEDNTDVWTKGLDYNKDTVHQQAESTNTCFSLRLVRNLGGSYSGIETISGVPYHCVSMPYIDQEGNTGNKLWTAENVTFEGLLEGSKEFPNAKAYNLTESDGSIIKEDPTYFVNYWNGRDWVKRQFKENESITLEVGLDSSENQDWILIDGELVKRIDLNNEEILREVDEKISHIKISGDSDDIVVKTYTLKVTEGVTLDTVKGNEIPILFDGNYGEFNDTSVDVKCKEVKISGSTMIELDKTGATSAKTITIILSPTNTTEEVTASTNDSHIAIVEANEDGTYTVTYKNSGTTTITFECGEAKKAYLSVKCNEPEAEVIPCTGINLITTSLKNLTIGDVYTLTKGTDYTLSPSNTTETGVTFSSSNSSVASVNSTNGKITINGSGDALITITSIDEPTISKSISISVASVDSKKMFITYYNTIAISGDGISDTYIDALGDEIQPLTNSVFDSSTTKSFTYVCSEEREDSSDKHHYLGVDVSVTGIIVPAQYSEDDLPFLDENEEDITDTVAEEKQQSVIFFVQPTTTGLTVTNAQSGKELGIAKSNMKLSYEGNEYDLYYFPIDDPTTTIEVKYNTEIKESIN